ncbi:hypothetical protein EVG20_g482 [Dentipellis fragilis]|uniref:histone deacetylase n=1 Tax=Dentipellis fragilis TaxID=205917 RepID=A0A4Y9ZGI4_9AGAM|nr:hypothetical protein EVG20_g482 [Dentipellis fragilis]
MVRKFETYTFSSSRHFSDRGANGIAQPITEHVNAHSRPIVSYYFPKGVGEHHYGQERHPMKPHRLSLTNALVIGYGLDKQIHNIYNPRLATREELENYHDPDYIDFLSRVTPGNADQMKHLIDSFNCVEDCPVFSDIYQFCRMSAGGSLAAARKLCAGATDIAINWSGGLHHAKRGEASGFCYVNDIVLGILELLKYHPRVLYIDIDIHHGDGVELAFYHSNRVMTVSFHKYTGDFFPGTGKLDDNGSGLGKHFCLNVPLKDGIDDDMYLTVFKTVIGDTVTAYQPTSIVLQCGADSLGLDRLGAFNLSIAAHGECVNFVRKFNVPLMVVGGGGYTIKNVSRCWTYETAVLVGAEVPDELPSTVYDPRFPPGLEEWLEEETKTAEEREEERGTAAAGEGRDDRTMARNEFFDGENDQDQDDVVEAKPKTGARRGRGGATKRTRGRGRTKAGAPGPSSLREEVEEDTEESTPAPAAKKSRARGGRARGRGRAKGQDKDKDKDKESVNAETPTNPDPDPSTPMDLDVDV